MTSWCKVYGRFDWFKPNHFFAKSVENQHCYSDGGYFYIDDKHIANDKDGTILATTKPKMG